MDVARNTDWQVTKLASALGAEVRGVNLAGCAPGEIEQVKRLLLEHLVLFFPGQAWSLDEHLAFGRRFGPLEGHPNLNNPFTEHDEIFELAASHGGVADEWHTDLTFQEQPALMSVLHMIKCPETGGDTLWASLYAAYDGLSAPLRDLCDGLSALHDAQPHKRPDRVAVHPVVRVHPETGRKALYVNEHFTRRIVEMHPAESDELLGYLVNWVKSPRFTVRYRWTEGTVAIWDNRCTQHTVLNDFTDERIVQRVTVVGDRVEGAPPRWQPAIRTDRVSAATRHDRQLYRYLKDRAEREQQADSA